jgi:two-component system nitrogen regulation response regulator GlnG
MTGAAEQPTAGEQFISASPAMQELYRAITRLMGNDLTVTITGDSGTGKTLMARMLHQLSGRRAEPFVALDVAAAPGDSLEPVMLEKLRRAGPGTLFLDEVDTLPEAAQRLLLHWLRQGEYCDPADGAMHPVRCRLLCATGRNLMLMVRGGQFLEDLYYRLNVIPLRIPPLRERREDIAPLAEYFLKLAASKGMPPRLLEERTIVAMQDYDWPGNVRELENMMYRFCTIHADSMVSPASFYEEVQREAARHTRPERPGTIEQDVEARLRDYFAAHAGEGLPPPGLYDRILPLVERPLIATTLAATGGNQMKAAYVLGINRNTLRKKMSALSIDAGGNA